MRKIFSPSFLIFLVVFINFLGYGIVFPTLPILTINYGGDPLISGIIIASFSVMQLLAIPVLGRLSDRFGRRPLLIYSLFGTFLSFLIMGAGHSIFWLFVARMIDGISGGNISIAQAFIADVTEVKNRAQGMGVVSAGITLGFIVGPLWGGLFSKINLFAPFYAAALITLLSLILTYFFLPESVSRKEITYERKAFNFRSFVLSLRERDLDLFFLTYFLIFWAQSGLFTVLSLFGEDVLHLSLVSVSLVFAFGAALSAFIQIFLIGRLTKAFSEERLFMFSAVFSALGMAVMSEGGTLGIFLLGNTIFSLGSSLLVPIAQSLVSEKTSKHEQGGSLGILQSFGSLGRTVGPVSGGYLFQAVSPFTPSVMGAVLFLLVFFLGLRIKPQV